MFLEFCNDLKRDKRRAAVKVFVVVWAVAILLSLLSLAGVRPAERVGAALSSLRANSDSSATLDAESVADAISEGPEEEEEDLAQKLPKAKTTKVDRKFEESFGCEEAKCTVSCIDKAKDKCKKSRSCSAEREKICKRRCRKTRCEERCKDEPKLGYVEREQGMEKCKSSCTGSTAQHNRCIKKCHQQFKACKVRCYEVANKYACPEDRLPKSMRSSVMGTESLEMDSKGKKGKKGNAAAVAETEESAPSETREIPDLGDDDVL